MSFFWVGLGGACGAIARVAFMRLIPPFVGTLPLKILLVNVLGCLIMGSLTELFALYGNLSINMRHFLIQGLLGGFTTFSAFSLEFGLLFQKGQHATAISYALLSVVLSIVFFFLGLRLIKGIG